MRASLVTYGILHFLVDAVGAATVFAILGRTGVGLDAPLLLVYGLISFASRPVLGLVVDANFSARSAAVFGSALVAMGSTLLSRTPFAAVITLGIGNALFHVGAGSICFRLKPGLAGPSGVFAAPGALGVFVGTVLGARALTQPWIIAMALVVTAGMSLTLAEPSQEQATFTADRSVSDGPIALLLLSIASISLAGFVFRFPWQATPSLAAVVVMAVVVGRALGGLLADRFGWRRIALGGLLFSIPFLAGGMANVVSGVLGLALLNLALPVASTAVFTTLRTHPAFAFGLVSLALIAGGLPALVGIMSPLTQSSVRVLLLPVACGALYVGFKKVASLNNAVVISRPSIPGLL
ncbi:MAG: hypothetical protein ABMA00_14600 [Gemmatimonas sp.]